jgi:hypothetical protein
VAKSAVTELTAHIESIRQEAYNEGYAAAMRAVVEFSTSGSARKTSVAKVVAAKTTSTKPTTATPTAPRRQRRVQAKPAAKQTRRTDNAAHIAEAMMTLPDHTGPAAAIKQVLASQGHDIPYSSIRNGLGQLQARGEASVADDGRTWSYTGTQHQ